MLTVLLAIVGLIAGLLVGGGAVLTLRRRTEGVSSLQAEEQARAILSEAETQKKELLLQAKETELRLRNDVESEGRERRAEITRIESRLALKEENLDKKGDQIERRDQSMRDKEAGLDRVRAEAEELRLEQQRVL